MARIVCIFFGLLFFSIFGYGQNTNFHKVYAFNDSLGIISNVYVKDSSYLLGASSGRFNRVKASSIKLDIMGNIINISSFKDINRNEALGFGSSKSYLNSDGKYWYLYTSRNTQGWESYPKILLFDDVLNSFQASEIDTLTNLYFQITDNSRLIVDPPNDRYYLALKYNYYPGLDTTSNLPWDIGTFIMCYELSNDSLLYIKRHNFSTTATTKPRRVMHNYLPYTNGNHLLILREDFDNNNFSNQYCKVLFYTIDPINGNVISTKTLQDTPWSNPGFGAAFINNEKDLLLSYSESTVLYTNTGQPYHAVRPTVARLDSNFNVVWKKVLRDNYSTTLACGDCIEKFVINQDSTFVSAHVARVFLTADSSHINYPIPIAS